jgi:DNA transformation protein
LAEILTKRNELRIGKLKSGGQSLQSGQLRPFSSTETSSLTNAQQLMAPPGLSQGKVQWFGGWGLSMDGTNLGLIAWDTLYLKTNAQTETQWLAADGEPFVYEAKGKPIKMNYHTPPAETLESPALMLPWTRLALQAALAVRKPPAAIASAR